MLVQGLVENMDIPKKGIKHSPTKAPDKDYTK